MLLKCPECDSTDLRIDTCITVRPCDQSAIGFYEESDDVSNMVFSADDFFDDDQVRCQDCSVVTVVGDCNYDLGDEYGIEK